MGHKTPTFTLSLLLRFYDRIKIRRKNKYLHMILLSLSFIFCRYLSKVTYVCLSEYSKEGCNSQS